MNDLVRKGKWLQYITYCPSSSNANCCHAVSSNTWADVREIGAHQSNHCSRYSDDYPAKMPSTFPQFQSLPPELQLMVFEEFLLESLKTRVVLLKVVETQIDWEWRVGNKEPLQAESPAALAATLREVNSTARSVADRFLARFGYPVDPLTDGPALIGTELGLSLSRDLFWLPDDLQRLARARLGPPSILAPTDGDQVAVVMLNLESLEDGLQWTLNRLHIRGDPGVFSRYFLKTLLLRILGCFPAAWKLIVTVDIPRRHISWGQLQEVGIGDTALLRMGGDVARRCYSVYNAYEMLQQRLMNDDDDQWFFHDHGWSGLALPELSFAFLRPA